MPNPLINAAFGSRNRSKRAPDRPEEPVAEHFTTPVFPYRGTENHGVEPPYRPREVPDNTGTIAVEFEQDKSEPDPIPVRIVTQGAKEFKDWFIRREYTSSGAQASRILTQDMSRTKAKIKNLGTVRIWVGPEDHLASPMFGYPIDTNGELELSSPISDVWARSDDGTQQPIAIIGEYTMKE